MNGSPNTSFIPKKSDAQREHHTSTRQVYVGTLLIRIFFAASFLASVGVYAYQYTLKKDLDTEVVALDSAIKTFNDAEMQRVIGTDKRLAQVSEIMSKTFSVNALLKAIEDSTVESVQIKNLSLLRDANDTIEIEAELDTASFNSALFQENILAKSDTLTVIEISDVTLENEEKKSETENVQQVKDSKVSFKATLEVAIEKVPHTVGAATPVVTAPVVAPEAVFNDISSTTVTTLPEEGGSSDSTESNQEEL
jgi:hypothetical protein